MAKPTDWSASTHLVTFFQQHLIVFAQSDAEDDRRDVFKTVNPLLPFASLTADVEHAVESELYPNGVAE